MARYVLRRLLWVIGVLLVVTFVTFMIFYVVPPGDPALNFAGKAPTQQAIDEVREQFGLDRPPLVQYGLFVTRLVAGDRFGWPGLGFSFSTRSAVRDELFRRAGVTLQLTMGAAVIWLLLGVPLGVFSAVKHRTYIDRVAMGFALFGVSIPVFWLGLMALYVFWNWLGIAGGTGYAPIGDGVDRWFSHMILPWLVLALPFIAAYARIVRGTMIETMGEDFIRTARAEGLSEGRVVVRHGLRASLTPVVTLIGLDVGSLLGGAVITETVFNLPGIGHLLVTSVSNGDLPMVLGVTVVGAVGVTLMNLVADILYGLLDPRVRYG